MNDYAYKPTAYNSQSPRSLSPFPDLDQFNFLTRRVKKNKLPWGIRSGNYLPLYRGLVSRYYRYGRYHRVGDPEDAMKHIHYCLRAPASSVGILLELAGPMLQSALVFVMVILIVDTLFRPDLWTQGSYYCSFLGIYGLYQLWLFYRDHRQRPQSEIRFERPSGMILMQHQGNTYHYRFDECDFFYQRNSGLAGLISYTGFVIHRYTGCYTSLCCYRTLNRVQLAWEHLQQFMDVSKPLPDTPEFEAVRAFDPVTAAYDQNTHRPTHYWRDLSEKQFLKRVQESLGTLDKNQSMAYESEN